MTNKIKHTTSNFILACLVLAFTFGACNGKSGDADKKATTPDSTTAPKMDAPSTPDSTGKKDSLADKPTAPADKNGGLQDKPTAPADAPK